MKLFYIMTGIYIGLGIFFLYNATIPKAYAQSIFKPVQIDNQVNLYRYMDYDTNMVCYITVPVDYTRTANNNLVCLKR